MEAVESARGYEPWRIEFLHMRELREDGYNEGYDEGIEDGRAEAQARIAELEAELVKYKGKDK